MHSSTWGVEAALYKAAGVRGQPSNLCSGVTKLRCLALPICTRRLFAACAVTLLSSRRCLLQPSTVPQRCVFQTPRSPVQGKASRRRCLYCVWEPRSQAIALSSMQETFLRPARARRSFSQSPTIKFAAKCVASTLRCNPSPMHHLTCRTCAALWSPKDRRLNNGEGRHMTAACCMSRCILSSPRAPLATIPRPTDTLLSRCPTGPG